MKRIIGVCLSMLLLLAGCSGKTMVESDLGLKGAPDWVNEGTQILNDKGGRYFHGVGQAPPMGDDSLQISTADNRARAEVAKIISSFIDVAHHDYSSASGSGGEVASEQAISQQIESLSHTNLSGSEIIGHWRDKKTGIIYSIAELDLKQVQKVVDASHKMNEGFGRFLESQGDNIFDRQAEEKK
ncbi:MAG: hypothetical protein KAG93_07260 [Desulfuromusa sp.]|nr:hypothetical protein [Desulfuromusa sp.]